MCVVVSSNQGDLALPGAKPPGPKLKNGLQWVPKFKKGQKPRTEIKKSETRNFRKDFDWYKECYSHMLEGREVVESLHTPFLLRLR